MKEKARHSDTGEERLGILQMKPPKGKKKKKKKRRRRKIRIKEKEMRHYIPTNLIRGEFEKVLLKSLGIGASRSLHLLLSVGKG